MLQNFSWSFFLKISAFISILWCIIIVFMQDYMIFPMLRDSSLPTPKEGTRSEIYQLQTGNSLEVWVRDGDANGPLASSGLIAILFCGNGGGLSGQAFMQSTFSKWGVKSYLVDYPGHGRSSGFPSEQLIYANAKEIANDICQRERIDPSHLIIGGNSLGTGFAAYLAKEISSKALTLFAGYADFTELVRDKNPIYRLLSVFLKYRMPTTQYIAQLGRTSLIAIHGTEDRTIPAKHLDEIISSYRGSGIVKGVLIPGAGHNDILDRAQDQVLQGLIEISHLQN